MGKVTSSEETENLQSQSVNQVSQNEQEQSGNKSFNSLMSATFPDHSNTLLTSTQNWKVLADGTIVLAVMTEKEVHIIALEPQ